MARAAPVSVIIRTYNRCSLLQQALESALAQTRRPGEIVVIDDASDDDTARVTGGYLPRHANLSYVRLPTNEGMYRAAQIGYRRTTLPYVAFLDSDDLWYPEHLAVCLAEVERDPALAMVYTRYGLIDLERRPLVDVVREPEPAASVLEALLLKRVVVQPSRTVYSRWAIAEVGGIPHHDIVGDWVLNVRIAARFPRCVRPLDARTALFRVHGSQSYSRPLVLRRAFIDATRDLYSELPFLPLSRSRVLANNLLHCAIFFWQSGDWREGWRSIYLALREDASICLTGAFAAASLRLVIPPALGRTGRAWKRAWRRRSLGDLLAIEARR